MINFKNFYRRVNFDIDYYAEERFLVKQNDTKSRGFYVKIIQDGRVVKPSASEKLTFYGRKPDGTDIFQDGVLDGGEFRIDLPNQAFTAPGEMRSEFSLRGPNGELISTKDFTITVIESFPMDPVESTDEFGALQSALAQIAGFAGELQDAQLFAESIKANLGELEDLDTDAKENAVAAINELNGKIDNVLNSEELETLLATKVDKDTLGDMSQLLTEEKEILVLAINEINAALKTVESVTDVEQLSILLSGKADKSSVGDLANLTTTQKNNLVAAINEINSVVDGLGDVDFSEIYTLLDGKVSQEDFDAAINAIELTPGPQGEPGGPGQPGADGADGYTPVKGVDYFDGEDGQDGKSAYQIWLDEGNVGTEQDFLESLEGPPGPPGGPGEGSVGGDNLGSVSSNEPLVNVTTEDSYQVNVSYHSKAHYHTEVYQYYIENYDYWVTLDNCMFPEIEEDYFPDAFLVEDNDKLFIYAEVDEYGYIDRIVKFWEGQDNPDLYQLVDFRTKYESKFTISYYNELLNYWATLDKYIFPEIEGYYFKGDFLVEDNNKLFIYAEFSEYGNIDRIVEIWEGQDNPNLYQLVEVRLDEIHGHSQVNASEGSQATGRVSQVNASESGQAAGEMSQVNASQNSQATGEMSQVNVSMDSQANKRRTQVNASSRSVANEYQSQINASVSSINNGLVSQINSSSRVINDIEHSTVYGYGPFITPGHEPGAPLAANVKIRLLSTTGDINHSGILNSGHNFTDYAELFPNLTGEEQGYGLLQTIDGHGVRPANSGDQVVGVTSATAGVILGETPFSWVDRWLKDEWGAFIYHDILDEDWEPNEDKGETEEDRPTITVPKENPEWDPHMEQVTRQERPDEWTVVGLVGQVYVRLDKNVEPMDYVKPLKDGVGQTSDEPTNIRVMKITQEFDKDKGYKIGFCLLK